MFGGISFIGFWIVAKDQKCSDELDGYKMVAWVQLGYVCKKIVLRGN